jgi:uncharacterized membrane protein YfcA
VGIVEHAGGWHTLALIFAGAVAGGVVNGLTGFGSALTALPVWLQAVEPLLAAQLGSACSVLGHLRTFPSIWRGVDWRRMAPMLAAGLAGVPIGTAILPYIGVGTFKAGLGVVLAAYCSFMLIAAGRSRIAAAGPIDRWAEPAVGFAGGVLGGLAALSGVLPTVWASLKDWRKDQRRIFFQAFNFTVLTAMLVANVASGLVSVRSIVAFAVAAPGTLIGASLGLAVYRRLDDVRFDRAVLAVLLLSGLALVWSSL